MLSEAADDQPDHQAPKPQVPLTLSALVFSAMRDAGAREHLSNSQMNAVSSAIAKALATRPELAHLPNPNLVLRQLLAEELELAESLLAATGRFLHQAADADHAENLLELARGRVADVRQRLED